MYDDICLISPSLNVFGILMFFWTGSEVTWVHHKMYLAPAWHKNWSESNQECIAGYLEQLFLGMNRCSRVVISLFLMDTKDKLYIVIL